jgi:hypothetical protein
LIHRIKTNHTGFEASGRILRLKNEGMSAQASPAHVDQVEINVDQVEINLSCQPFLRHHIIPSNDNIQKRLNNVSIAGDSCADRKYADSSTVHPELSRGDNERPILTSHE